MFTMTGKALNSQTIQKSFTLAAAKKVGDKLGVDWKEFDLSQFRLGLNVEIAVGVYNPITIRAVDDPIQIGKIVRAHLHESPDYYTQWVQMEKATARKQEE